MSSRVAAELLVGTTPPYQDHQNPYSQELFGELQGGNADSNLVDWNYHQDMAETNIPKTLSCLSCRLKTDDVTVEECVEAIGISSDQF